MKTPAVINARLWFAAPTIVKGTDRKPGVFIECALWVDARRIARSLLGADVDIVQIGNDYIRKTPTRTQARWVGSAASRVPDLRIQTRRVLPSGKATKWTDLRWRG